MENPLRTAWDTNRGHAFSLLHHAFFFSLLFGGITLFAYVVSPFFAPLFWAVVIAIVLYPLQKRLRTWSEELFNLSLNATITALLTICIFLICIFLPLGIVASLIADEALSVYSTLSNDDATLTSLTTRVSSELAHFGFSPEQVQESIITYGKDAASWLSLHALSIGTATLVTLLHTVILVYMLFFLLRDGERSMRFVHHVLPLGAAREQALFRTFTSITRSIFKGTLVVALVQGVIGGILFALAGVPHVFLAAALMTFFACIPGVGPALVWLPVSVALFALGDMWGGLIILLGGSIIIGLVDNILRPILVGRETAIPDPVIFISILGGLSMFGIQGIILGPVSAGLCLALLRIYSEEYRGDLERH